MTRRQKIRRIALVVVAGMTAGGAIGAGVGLGLYPPAVAVTLAIITGLSVGVVVRRLILAVRADSRGQGTSV